MSWVFVNRQRLVAWLHQAITRANASWLSTGLLRKKISEISIKIQRHSPKNTGMHFKMMVILIRLQYIKITIWWYAIVIFEGGLASIGMTGLVNSLWPSDTIWRHKSGSTLAQVMACCLTAPSHYLNQCWLVINKVQWHPSESNFTWDTPAISHWN